MCFCVDEGDARAKEEGGPTELVRLGFSAEDGPRSSNAFEVRKLLVQLLYDSLQFFVEKLNRYVDGVLVAN